MKIKKMWKIVLATVAVLVVGILVTLLTMYYLDQTSRKLYQDQTLGVSFSFDKHYQETPSDDPQIKYFERTDPQGFLMVKYESGLRGIASRLGRTIQDHIYLEIQQFYPVRYGESYKSVSLKKTTIIGREAVEHIFTYTDKDGKPNEVKLVAIVFDTDSAYYFVEQAHETLFDVIKEDLTPLFKTLVLTGPAPAPAEESH